MTASDAAGRLRELLDRLDGAGVALPKAVRLMTDFQVMELRRDLRQLLAEHATTVARVAELDDVRAVAALLRAVKDDYEIDRQWLGAFGTRALSALEQRFADRIAVLDAAAAPAPTTTSNGRD